VTETGVIRWSLAQVFFHPLFRALSHLRVYWGGTWWNPCPAPRRIRLNARPMKQDLVCRPELVLSRGGNYTCITHCASTGHFTLPNLKGCRVGVQRRGSIHRHHASHGLLNNTTMHPLESGSSYRGKPQDPVRLSWISIRPIGTFDELDAMSGAVGQSRPIVSFMYRKRGIKGVNVGKVKAPIRTS